MHQHDQSRRPKSADQVMTNKLKSVKRDSKSAAASQPKTVQSPGAPRQATFASRTADKLCLYDAGVGELAGEIPLVGRELPSVVAASYRQGISVDQFIADAIREKRCRDHSGALTSKLTQSAVQVLVDLAVRKVLDCPIDEQIFIWKALSETLPDSFAREHAREIALHQSTVSARRLQLYDILAHQAAKPLSERAGAQ